MGGKTKKIIEDREAKEAFVQSQINSLTKNIKEKLSIEKPLLDEIPNELRGLAVRPYLDFTVKTKSSNRDKQLLELVKHMYVKYPVSKVLEKAWVAVNQNQQTHQYRNNRQPIYRNEKFDFRKWYVCVATGGSLYKEHCKDILTKKEVHLFLTCKMDLTLNQTLFFAVARANGASDGIAARIAKSKISEKPFNEFWINCTRFFSVHQPESVNQLSDLTDFLEAKRLEENKFTVMGFGYTLKSLLDKMRDWHYALRRLKVLGSFSWDGFPIDDHVFEKLNEHKKVITWRIHQIKNTKELSAEGTAMHHCVFSYKDRCIKGTCSIWSLTSEDMGVSKRRVTIEVNDYGRIIQARGFANRSVKSDERFIISEWAKKNNLDYVN